MKKKDNRGERGGMGRAGTGNSALGTTGSSGTGTVRVLHEVRLIEVKPHFVMKAVKMRKGRYLLASEYLPANVAQALHLSKTEEFIALDAREAKWWDMLEWSKMLTTWDMLPKEFQDKIRAAGVQVPD